MTIENYCLAAIVAVLCMFAYPRLAQAQGPTGPAGPADCPVAPDALGEDADAPAKEARQLRRDVDASCAAIADKLDRLHDQGANLLSKAGDSLDAQERSADALEGVVKVREQGEGPTGPTGPSGAAGDPVRVQLASEDSRQLYSLRYIAAMLLGAAAFAGCASLLRRAWGF